MKCHLCQKTIKHPYKWKGEIYGIECWKKLALPVIEAERARKNEERLAQRMIESKLISDTLAEKDLSKITNNYKLDFIQSVIERVGTGKPLTNNQIEFARSIFNQSDCMRYDLACLVLEGVENKIIAIDTDKGYRGKFIKLAVEALGSLPPNQEDWYGDPITQ